MTKLTKEILELFDEKFGKAGPEKNCDSIGRSAGCDDCSENIELREEHKSFLQEVVKRAYGEGFFDGKTENDLERYAQAKEDGTLDKHFPVIRRRDD